jgi:hypothetical protein
VLMVLGNGLFGYRFDEAIWPLGWLINGPNGSPATSLGRTLGSSNPLLLQAEAVVGQLLVATNPLLAGIASAAGLVQGRPLVAWERVGSNNVDLPYVAPWLLFGVVHLLAALGLIWLTTRSLGRARR